MTEQIKSELKDKMTTPQEAVRLVKSGDTVFFGFSSSTANTLLDALNQRSDELENVTLAGGMAIGPTKIFQNIDPRAFRICTCFMGPSERKARSRTWVDFTSVHLSQIDLFLQQTAPADVAFLEVSPPDDDGYVCFGASGSCNFAYVIEKAKKIILQINRNAPYLYGEENTVHISRADAIVEGDYELAEVPDLPADETTEKISAFIIDEIPDGACIQLGIGGLSSAIGYGLENKNELGIHTEMVTTSMMHLIKSGVVTNSRKSFHPGKTVAAFAYGTKELYSFLDHNPDVYFMRFPIINNPNIIAQNDNMISVNTALTIDLMGQVVADSIEGVQYSATGGQLDYVRGAQASKGGKSFIAITSSRMDKGNVRRGRIVSRLPEGSVVTTPRSDVQYVVTEYGCVNLKTLCMRDRVLAMISLAHPDDRAQLTEDAKKLGLIYA